MTLRRTEEEEGKKINVEFCSGVIFLVHRQKKMGRGGGAKSTRSRNHNRLRGKSSPSKRTKASRPPRRHESGPAPKPREGVKRSHEGEPDAVVPACVTHSRVQEVWLRPRKKKLQNIPA